MPKGYPTKNMPRPETADRDLAIPYPVVGGENRKLMWHLRQFYALRAKALEGAVGVHTAIIAQSKMLDIDLAGGMPPPTAGQLRNGGIQGMLPVAASESEALDGALEKSRGRGKGEEPTGEEGEG